MLHPIRAERLHRHLPCWVTGHDVGDDTTTTIWATHTRPSEHGMVVVVGADWVTYWTALCDGAPDPDATPAVLILDPYSWVAVAGSRVDRGWQALLDAIRDIDDRHNGGD